MESRTEARGQRTGALDPEIDAARHAIRVLSRPRMTGSPGAVEVEVLLRGAFEEQGYEVQELPFQFSVWPGRFGVPALGAVTLLGLGAATYALASGRPGTALIALACVALLAGLAAAFARRAITDLPWGRVEGKNLLAHRPGARPRYLIVAHRDSKSQPISTFLRITALVLVGFAWCALLTVAAIGSYDTTLISLPLVLSAGVLGGAGGALLASSVAGNASAGALDNATGLVALLGIARRQRDYGDVAFLVTDGEELGLAGAWDAARRLPPLEGVINLDGLDDYGDFRITERIGPMQRRVLAPHLAAALLASAASLGVEAERRDLPLGIMVDHIPFGRAGFPALTLLRGTARSLFRVHRRSDTPDRLTGIGATLTVSLVCGALDLLRSGRLHAS